MARIQQSIDIGVPVHVVYNQLTQFEDYPRFMQDIEAVKQLDDTHLHWTAKVAQRDMQWDATITEQIPDRSIAWQSSGGPAQSGKVEVQAVGTDAARVTLTLDAQPQQAGQSEDEMSQQAWQNLARLKKLVEHRAAEPSAWRGEIHDAQVTLRDRDARRQSGGNAEAAQAERTTQSDYSLSRTPDGDNEEQRFSIAEEVNFDEQSDQARRVGQMPNEPRAAASPAEGMADAMKQQDGQDAQDAQDAQNRQQLKEALDRAMPPSA